MKTFYIKGFQAPGQDPIEMFDMVVSGLVTQTRPTLEEAQALPAVNEYGEAPGVARVIRVTVEYADEPVDD